LGRPAPFDGAFVDPKWTFCIARTEQQAILAVWSSVGPWSPCNLLLFMFWVSSCVKTAKFGAIVVSSTVDAGIGLPQSRGSVKHISDHQVTLKIKGLCVQNFLKEFRYRGHRFRS
jgi:hypothetical protein